MFTNGCGDGLFEVGKLLDIFLKASFGVDVRGLTFSYYYRLLIFGEDINLFTERLCTFAVDDTGKFATRVQFWVA